MGDNMIDDAVETYQNLSCFASVKSGSLSNRASPGHIQATTVWSQRDLDRKENLTFNKNYLVQLDVVLSTPPKEINKRDWSVESPSGKYTAVIRTVPQKTGDGKQFIEVWSSKQRLHNISVEALDQHGKIYEAGSFGCLEWSNAETHILYIAEKKKPKPKSYFEQSASSSKPDTDAKKGDEFVYEDDWGEQLTGKSESVVCVLDIEAKVVSLLDNLPEDVSAGHAVWCPEDLGVICVGWYHGPFRLGKIYCPIRRNALFHIDLKTFKCEILGSCDNSVDTPMFSPNKSRFVYLESNCGGPHAQCTRLKMCDWSTKGIVTVKDIVRDIKNAEEFPGLFVQCLHNRCWSKDSKRIVTSTNWRSKMELIVIHCETGTVTKISNEAAVGSWTLLDVHDDIILAVCSSPTRPQYLVLGHLPASGQESSIKWLQLDDPESIPDLSWQICNIDGAADERNKTFGTLNYEYIVLTPANTGVKVPMIVFPHGGPHSSFSSEFLMYPACLCKLGYLIVCVNYRGSYGFGQDSIECLPGHIGTQDVQDVQAAAVKVLETHNVDPERVFVMGGSHGGFLTAHLIGQYPSFYKAAVLRNPVTNIASMVGSSDIPDWTHVEIDEPYDNTQKQLGSPHTYKTAWEKSPIQYVDKVRASVLLCIGQNDRRVPPSQAHEYRKALLTRGVKVRMLSYPDNSHPIIKVDSEADCFINIVSWFTQHEN